MDLERYGSLADMVMVTNKYPSEKDLGVIFCYLVPRLARIHERGIIHRDIKARNLMGVTIGDFGVSAFMENPRKKLFDIAGTPLWMAPEMLSGQGYTQKADIWSLGITLIELAEGLPPHIEKEPAAARNAIVNGPAPCFSEPTKWSPSMNHFLSVCLEKDPRKRPTAEKLISHPFLINDLGIPSYFIEAAAISEKNGKLKAMGEEIDDVKGSARYNARISRKSEQTRTVKFTFNPTVHESNLAVDHSGNSMREVEGPEDAWLPSSYSLEYSPEVEEYEEDNCKEEYREWPDYFD
eukprot:TRINITY_DN5033_c0_g1_i6.p1 TRINITY_DN5033_c0_g1~~TRINITY_DN5033_c0_g1_i6.p1  ORF type:complete len:294 (-),score=62.99 TRINITY_DN5033_c0_g1_i6:68-949(-)